ncbi:MAG: ThuA domain-containing protein [Cellulophaga sp.]
MKKKILISVLAIIGILIIIAYFALFRTSKNDIKVLVFSKTENFRHSSIEIGIEAIKKLGAENNFIIETTEDGNSFNEEYLKDFQAVIFLNTTFDVLNPVQQSQMERFIQSGGGYVGVHSATDTEYGWPWYGKLVGAYFDSHPNDPNVQEATVSVVNPNHKATDSLPTSWKTKDEWYNYKAIDSENKVLLKVDESTYKGGTNGDNHPIAWYKEYDGGRSFYTGLGHTEEQYSNPIFLNHLLGGIQYAIGPGSLIDYSKAYSEAVPEENRFSKTVFTQNLAEPMELDFLSKNKIIFIERKGAIHIYDLQKNEDKTIHTMNVFSGLEDGLIGLAVDPNYAENNWIYMYYSDPNNSVQHLSRFVLKNDSLHLSSEKILLKIPVQRAECCHSGGSIEFGPDGNLFLSVGDNTNPHESNGFAPIDDRSQRSPWDAQKSSANTNDLRGKILRIKPKEDGTYTIPDGNLFPLNNKKTRPEIYIMGNRNPYRISIDKHTKYLYWGEVGPDANKDSIAMGIRGYDEINQAKSAGNFGWPYFIANNKAYHNFDFTNNMAGKVFDPKKPLNNSNNNTGLNELPPAQAAMMYYPYASSEEFPEFGSGARNAMAGPIYYSKDFTESGRNFPEYFDGKLLVYDWMRGWIFAATLNSNGDLEKLIQVVPNMKFNNIIDMVFGPDGALYILEYGSGWFTQNANATLSRIEFTKGNRIPVAKISADKTIGAEPLTVQFSGRNSIDYDGDTLVYSWSFGVDDTLSSETTPSYTFRESGKYTVKLTVTDPEGNISTSETEILVGNELPQLSWNITKGNSDFYWPNSPVSITYKLAVNDSEDGSLAEGTLDASRVIVSFDYLSEGYDKIQSAKNHAELADEAYTTVGENIIGGSDCLACHKVMARSIGPSFKAIADKYETDSNANAMLADKIINGGGGNWGEVPMAAHPDLTSSEVEQMVRYILSISKQKSTISKYPTKGVYISKEHMDSKTQGDYILTASYTDQGGGEIAPLTAQQSFTLKYPKIEAEDYDDGQSMKFFVNAEETPGVDEDMTIVIGTKGSFFMFEAIDLTDVTGIKGAFGIVSGITKGGDVEFRIGGLEGQLIAKQTIEVGLTDLGFEEITIDLKENIKGKQDLYIVFKTEEDADDTVVVIIDWIEFTNKNAN